MEVLRTPDECFEGLPGYGFEPRYVEVDDLEGGRLRLNRIDEGPSDGPVVLLLHGEPSWSYLYRAMVPPLVAAGCRVVAPDLAGFGRSDKPAAFEDYTYERHVAWLSAHLFDELDLSGITLFCQDWGGLLGLRLLAAAPERFSAAVISNTFLPTGATKLSEAFMAWRTYSQEVEGLPVGRIVDGGCVRSLSPEEVSAYDAPYPDDSYKAGARAFPTLVPADRDAPSAAENRAAWEVLRTLEIPVLTAFGDEDKVSAGSERWFIEQIPGAAGQPHRILHAGHFIQEDVPDELVPIILEAMGKQGGN